jgi:hypothetical protein
LRHKKSIEEFTFILIAARLLYSRVICGTALECWPKTVIGMPGFIAKQYSNHAGCAALAFIFLKSVSFFFFLDIFSQGGKSLTK